MKLRKQGNSLTITIPASFHKKEGDEFLMHLEENGSIILIPKIPNMFEGKEDFSMYQTEEWKDLYKPTGREWNE
ncbi:MAG: AbrB/MazE/SpoVT family DNA-binding domain-containing protein [Lachnospiraceae bacterium]|jgi:antitoxin component of MazEF toxin-antitoxin module|nr:AbrB/MazE/SpoVT family DNA-binding domain-containing protein [Lachnospiraceae bacterium]